MMVFGKKQKLASHSAPLNHATPKVEPKLAETEIKFFDLSKTFNGTIPITETVEKNELTKSDMRYLSLVSCFVNNRQDPFVDEKTYKKYVDFMNSKAPKDQNKIETLAFLRDNDLPLATRENIMNIISYISKNFDLIERLPHRMNLELNLDGAIRKTINNADFIFNDVNNPFKEVWEKIRIKYEKLPTFDLTAEVKK